MIELILCICWFCYFNCTKPSINCFGMFETEVVFHNGWRWVVAVAVAVAVAESVSRVKRDFYQNALRVRATEQLQMLQVIAIKPPLYERNYCTSSSSPPFQPPFTFFCNCFIGSSFFSCQYDKWPRDWIRSNWQKRYSWVILLSVWCQNWIAKI